MIYEKQYNYREVVAVVQKSKKNNEPSKDNKNQQRFDQLHQKYNILRSHPFSLAVSLSLNHEEKIEIVPEPVVMATPVETKPEPTKKKK
jgi:hypothetical protein